MKHQALVVLRILQRLASTSIQEHPFVECVIPELQSEWLVRVCLFNADTAEPLPAGMPARCRYSVLGWPVSQSSPSCQDSVCPVVLCVRVCMSN